MEDHERHDGDHRLGKRRTDRGDDGADRVSSEPVESADPLDGVRERIAREDQEQEGAEHLEGRQHRATV
jgi:hypothetical protein